MVAGLCLLFTPLVAQATLLTNGGFEQSVSTSGGVPLVPGVWQGDYSQIVFAARGVQAYDGQGMLRFIATRPLPPGDISTGSEVFQMVDLTQHRTLISTGFAAARLTAQFNRVPGDEQTDERFGLGLYSSDNLSGVLNPTTLPRLESTMLSDSNPATWEQHTLTWMLPSETVGIYALVEASENIFNDRTTIEFDGHYADGVTLDVFPAIPGDTNGDGKVNVVDLINVRNNFGEVGEIGLLGDAFPPDGRVNITDLNLVRGNFGGGLPTAVPEPSSLAFAAAVALVIGVGRSRHCRGPH